MPLISIITSTYNSEVSLAKFFLSIQKQTSDNFELIMVDGDSSDNTLAIIKRHKHLCSKIISEPDESLYEAWNKGLEYANGNWITFVGSDDYIESDYIESYENHIETIEKSVNFICSKVRYINKKGEILKLIDFPLNKEELKRGFRIAHVGALHHRSLFEEFGKFDTSYKITADYDFLLRSLKRLQPSYLNKITANMISGGISSGDNLLKAISEARKAKINNKSCSPILANYDFLKLYFIVTIKKLLKLY